MALRLILMALGLTAISCREAPSELPDNSRPLTLSDGTVTSLSPARALAIADGMAEELGYDLSNYPDREARCSRLPNAPLKWLVVYGLERWPGDHVTIFVSDADESTEILGGR